MRLLKRNFDKHGEGELSLIAENEEDIWNIYNLIQIGDSIRASTVRKIHNESATGSVNVKQVRLNLTISIESITYDSVGSTLHLKGRNLEENKHVKLGAYHTLDVATGEKFTIRKSFWDTVAFELVETACDAAQQADLGAIIMHEGLAHVCLITPSATLLRAKIELSVPRKRRAQTQQHEKGVERFFKQLFQAFERHIRLDLLKCFIIASPGFLKDEFFKYILSEATRLEKKYIFENRSKFLLVHSSSGHRHALQEVLTDPSCAGKLQDTKAAAEVTALDQFFDMMKIDPCRAFYGRKHVLRAIEALAVETLLILDSLFRSSDIKQRQFYVGLVDRVKDSQGQVRIFSSMHVSGEHLQQLSGIAAILRFPLPEPDSDDEEDDLDTDLNVEESSNCGGSSSTQQFMSASNQTNTLVTKVINTV